MSTNTPPIGAATQVLAPPPPSLEEIYVEKKQYGLTIVFAEYDRAVRAHEASRRKAEEGTKSPFDNGGLMTPRQKAARSESPTEFRLGWARQRWVPTLGQFTTAGGGWPIGIELWSASGSPVKWENCTFTYRTPPITSQRRDSLGRYDISKWGIPSFRLKAADLSTDPSGVTYDFVEHPILRTVVQWDQTGNSIEHCSWQISEASFPGGVPVVIVSKTCWVTDGDNNKVRPITGAYAEVL